MVIAKANNWKVGMGYSLAFVSDIEYVDPLEHNLDLNLNYRWVEFSWLQHGLSGQSFELFICSTSTTKGQWGQILKVIEPEQFVVTEFVMHNGVLKPRSWKTNKLNWCEDFFLDREKDICLASILGEVTL